MGHLVYSISTEMLVESSVGYLASARWIIGGFGGSVAQEDYSGGSDSFLVSPTLCPMYVSHVMTSVDNTESLVIFLRPLDSLPNPSGYRELEGGALKILHETTSTTILSPHFTKTLSVIAVLVPDDDLSKVPLSNFTLLHPPTATPSSRRRRKKV